MLTSVTRITSIIAMKIHGLKDKEKEPLETVITKLYKHKAQMTQLENDIARL